MDVDGNARIHSKRDVNPQPPVAIPLAYANSILHASNFYGTFPETT
jgi:hypothetical protein